MVISDSHPSVGEVANGLGAEVMSGGMISAVAWPVPNAVGSKIGVETEHGGAAKVGCSLIPSAQSSQHPEDSQLGCIVSVLDISYSPNSSPQLSVAFRHCCFGQSLFAGMLTTATAKR
jgi:hypothetical protein